MQKFAAVYFLKNQIETINNFRASYDSSTLLIPPHITIVSPISELSEEELIIHVERLLQGVSTFSIQLNGLMETPDHCLFLTVKNGSEQITSLHDTLYSGILEKYIPKDYPFIPHVTLGCFEENGIYKERIYSKAYVEAISMNLNISDIFDSISIIKGDGISPATMLRTVSLSKKE